MLVQKMGVKVDLSFIMAVTSLFADLPSRAAEVGLGPALVNTDEERESHVIYGRKVERN